LQEFQGGAYPNHGVVNKPCQSGGFTMSKVLFAILLVGLLACGTGESNSGAIDSTSDTPAVSAVAPTDDDADMGAIEEPAIIEGEQADVEADAAAIRSCIDLVASGDFDDALPVCLEAASIDAENADVQAALAKTQASLAKAQLESAAATGATANAVENAIRELGN